MGEKYRNIRTIYTWDIDCRTIKSCLLLCCFSYPCYCWPPCYCWLTCFAPYLLFFFASLLFFFASLLFFFASLLFFFASLLFFFASLLFFFASLLYLVVLKTFVLPAAARNFHDVLCSLLGLPTLYSYPDVAYAPCCCAGVPPTTSFLAVVGLPGVAGVPAI
jgi:hypothetical protein